MCIEEDDGVTGGVLRTQRASSYQTQALRVTEQLDLAIELLNVALQAALQVLYTGTDTNTVTGDVTHIGTATWRDDVTVN